MTATAAFLAGLRRARVHWRLVVPLYAANLLVAALCAVAVHGVVSSAFGSSQAPQAFLEGFDLTTTADMLREQGEGTGAVLTQLPWMLLLSIFLSTFLAGGVLSTLSAGGTFSARVFLHGCAEYAGRFTRLLAAMLILGVLVMAAVAIVCVLLYEAIADDASSEWGVIWTVVLCGAVCGAALILLVTVSDYARVLIVTQRAVRVRESVRTSVRFIARNLAPVTLLIAFFTLLTGALTALYLLLEGSVPGAAVVVWVVLQQAFIASRTWVRVAGCGSQLALAGSRWVESSRTPELPLESYRTRV